MRPEYKLATQMVGIAAICLSFISMCHYIACCNANLRGAPAPAFILGK